MEVDKFMYEFDVGKNQLIADCNFRPTEFTKSDTPWLYAQNNKYDESHYEKVGKWMLFLPKASVNEIWNKIKAAITTGDLWHAKVSTTNPEKASYAIMIYTKDHTDLNDVISVLDFLEVSGIKSTHTIIKYKTDEQTRAGVYSYFGQKASIYSSDTIRQGGNSRSWRNTQSVK